MSLTALTLLAALASPAHGAAVARGTGYTVNVGALGAWKTPSDTPAASFIDKDGSYHLQQSAAAYGASEERHWSFYAGADIDSAVWDRGVSSASDPRNPLDSNYNTTWRCNNSPTGKIATYASGYEGTGKPYPDYSQKNYCDLIGVWVDPDTGYWYGLVHNEFSGRPFGDALHFDRIDSAVSRDQGRTWTILEGIISTPYGAYKRNDSTTFPGATYSWGAGDQRLVVDVASGYFYLHYYSRIVDKGHNNWWTAYYAHVARAPISAKFAAGAWRKWYNGSWGEPGLGGRESGVVPVVSDSDTGYTPPEKDYNPRNLQNASEQIRLGLTPPTTPLFWMDASYSPYLGQWVGEPNALEHTPPRKSPQQFYATCDLTTQRWRLIGDSGAYATRSQYRWFIDSAGKTSSHYIGRHFRGYCSFYCSQSDSEYVELNIEPASPPAPVVDSGKRYTLTTVGGRQLSAGNGTAWRLSPTGDGAYAITSGAGTQLGTRDEVSERAWGTRLGVFPASTAVGRQWWLIPNRSHVDNSLTGTFRIVNRWSGLVLALSEAHGLELVPHRSWTDTTGSGVGGGRRAEDQAIVLAAV
ncbi:hypothetical protein Q8F55_007212 [Vanrija albida]|uniref:Ricin B lectin domain-containing protein n=1 Tax=Vanrija albida TaxID=181172 RepID=A0ABR3Q076_9TREE